jgi:hypothetical protein
LLKRLQVCLPTLLTSLLSKPKLKMTSNAQYKLST